MKGGVGSSNNNSMINNNTNSMSKDKYTGTRRNMNGDARDVDRYVRDEKGLDMMMMGNYPFESV